MTNSSSKRQQLHDGGDFCLDLVAKALHYEAQKALEISLCTVPDLHRLLLELADWYAPPLSQIRYIPTDDEPDLQHWAQAEGGDL